MSINVRVPFFTSVLTLWKQGQQQRVATATQQHQTRMNAGARDATRLEPQATINVRTFFCFFYQYTTSCFLIGSKIIIFIRYVKQQNDATTNTNDVHYHVTKCR